MTDTIQQKVLAMMDEVRCDFPNFGNYSAAHTALYRAVEQHEAFRQEVSDAVMQAFPNTGLMPDCLSKLIIPAPKPDPLVDVFCKGLWSEAGLSISTKEIRATLEARGFEIREKGE